MAPLQSSKDSLDVLQDMFNDVLIKTGKALRASHQEASGQTYPNLAPTHFKIPETLQNFSSALDGMEHDIIRAKSILLRDLERVQNSKANTTLEEPQPIEAQSKSPMLVELDSSPGAKGEDGGPALTETKSLAPFPDMGMGLGIESAPGDAIANGSEDAPKTETQTAVKTEGLTPGTATGAPATAPETKPSDAGESVPGVSDSGLTFTNMEFSLAAPDNGGQGDQQTGQDQPESFDLTSLTAQAGNGNGNDASNNLDSILPPTSTDQGANSIGENGAPSGDQSQMANGQTDLGVPSFEGLNMENMDFGAADGTDFDFSMDDGNSFDDLMNSHEQNFDAAMDPGQFDADFFELDKTEGA